MTVVVLRIELILTHLGEAFLCILNDDYSTIPFDNAGEKTIPNYSSYARKYVYEPSPDPTDVSAACQDTSFLSPLFTFSQTFFPFFLFFLFLFSLVTLNIQHETLTTIH